VSWQDEYKTKCVSPGEAVKIIESGDTVVIPVATEVQALSRALMNRGNELKNVNVLLRMPRFDLGWLVGDVGDAFSGYSAREFWRKIHE
jgi:hypothetical protein